MRGEVPRGTSWTMDARQAQSFSGAYINPTVFETSPRSQRQGADRYVRTGHAPAAAAGRPRSARPPPQDDNHAYARIGEQYPASPCPDVRHRSSKTSPYLSMPFVDPRQWQQQQQQQQLPYQWNGEGTSFAPQPPQPQPLYHRQQQQQERQQPEQQQPLGESRRVNVYESYSGPLSGLPQPQPRAPLDSPDGTTEFLAPSKPHRFSPEDSPHLHGRSVPTSAGGSGCCLSEEQGGVGGRPPVYPGYPGAPGFPGFASAAGDLGGVGQGSRGHSAAGRQRSSSAGDAPHSLAAATAADSTSMRQQGTHSCTTSPPAFDMSRRFAAVSGREVPGQDDNASCSLSNDNNNNGMSSSYYESNDNKHSSNNNNYNFNPTSSSISNISTRSCYKLRQLDTCVANFSLHEVEPLLLLFAEEDGEDTADRAWELSARQKQHRATGGDGGDAEGAQLEGPGFRSTSSGSSGSNNVGNGNGGGAGGMGRMMGTRSSCNGGMSSSDGAACGGGGENYARCAAGTVFPSSMVSKVCSAAGGSTVVAAAACVEELTRVLFSLDELMDLDHDDRAFRKSLVGEVLRMQSRLEGAQRRQATAKSQRLQQLCFQLHSLETNVTAFLRTRQDLNQQIHAIIMQLDSLGALPASTAGMATAAETANDRNDNNNSNCSANGGGGSGGGAQSSCQHGSLAPESEPHASAPRRNNWCSSNGGDEAAGQGGMRDEEAASQAASTADGTGFGSGSWMSSLPKVTPTKDFRRLLVRKALQLQEKLTSV